MEKKIYNGLELLEAIKNNIIEDNTVIRVYKDDKEKFYLKYIDKDIQWNQSGFRLQMLLDDTYKYEIVNREPIINALKQLDNIEQPKIKKILKYIDTILYCI